MKALVAIVGLLVLLVTATPVQAQADGAAAGAAEDPAGAAAEDPASATGDPARAAAGAAGDPASATEDPARAAAGAAGDPAGAAEADAAAAEPAVAELAPVPAAGPAAPTGTDRYGWKIAAVDAVSLAALYAGVILVVVAEGARGDSEDFDNLPSSSTLGPVLMVAGSLGYLLGGSVVHGAHGNHRGIAPSVGLKVTLPVIGWMVGRSVGNSARGGVVLSLAGVATASVIDAWVLGRREVGRAGSVTPFAAPTAGGGVTLGVTGAF